MTLRSLGGLLSLRILAEGALREFLEAAGIVRLLRRRMAHAPG